MQIYCVVDLLGLDSVTDDSKLAQLLQIRAFANSHRKAVFITIKEVDEQFLHTLQELHRQGKYYEAAKLVFSLPRKQLNVPDIFKSFFYELMDIFGGDADEGDDVSELVGESEDVSDVSVQEREDSAAGNGKPKLEDSVHRNSSEQVEKTS